MNETDSKRLRHHTSVLPANYSAADRLLDEAVDQAVREEYPAAPPILVRKNATWQQPVPDEEFEPLKFGKTRINVKRFSGDPLKGSFSLHLFYSEYSPSFSEAAEAMATELSVASDGLRRMAAAERQRPEIPQPSVTAGTSAALVEEYAGKEVSP